MTTQPAERIREEHDQSQSDTTPALVASPAQAAPKSPSDRVKTHAAKVNLPRRLRVDDFPHPPRSFGEEPPTTIENIEHLLKSYKISVRYDVIKKKTRITIPGLTGSNENADNSCLTHIISLASLNGLAIGQLPALIEAIADRNPVNTVAEWIRSQPWDGVDRLPSIYATLTTAEDYPAEFKEILMRRWLLSAVAAALKPAGFKARGVLTLQGAQGIGKTSWITALVPDPVLRESVIKVDHHLDAYNKDSVLGAVSHWIVEIGELDGAFRKSDVARLKGVLTSDSDKVRRPYARVESEYPRRTVFAATVNEAQFLVDPTGNSRWWTLPLVRVDHTHDLDMQQVFAQLAVSFDAGEQWWLTADEERRLEGANQQHRSVSLMRDRLHDSIDLESSGDTSHEARGSVEILRLLGYDRPTNGDCRELTGLLRELLGEPKKIRGTMKWRVPFSAEFISKREGTVSY